MLIRFAAAILLFGPRCDLRGRGASGLVDDSPFLDPVDHDVALQAAGVAPLARRWN
jgi:hypothetical protein